MTSSTCPRCHETFRIPSSGVSTRAFGQCPWCHESFPLAEVLDRLPPMLTIVTGAGAEGAMDGTSDAKSWVESDREVTAGQLSEPQPADTSTDLGTIDGTDDLVESFELDGSDDEIGETVAFRDSIDFSEEDSNHQVTGVPAIPEPNATAVNVRPAKRKKSGGSLRSLAGVVLGGLLAVPIAGAIMWVAGIGYFEQDDFANYRVAPPPAPAATQPASISPSDEPITFESASAETLPELSGVGDVAAPTINTESSLTMPNEAASDETADLETGGSDASAPVSDTVDSESSEPTVVAPVPTPEPDSAELVSTVDLATKMISALDSLDPGDEKRPGWLTKTYERISAAADSAGVHSPAMAELAETIKQSTLVADFEQAGGDWMDFVGRSNDGVLLIGQSDGMVLSLNSGKSISISGPLMLPSSGQTLVLGRILDSATVEAVAIESM